MNIDFGLTETQRKFILDNNLCTLYSGGVGAGKTTGCLFKALFLSRFISGNIGLVLAPDRSQIFDTILPEMKRFFLNHIIKIGNDPNPSILIRTANQSSKIILRTYKSENDIAKIKSLSVGWVWLHEAAEMDESVWSSAIGRLRLWNYDWLHRIFIDCNPSEPDHWINKLFQKGNKGFMRYDAHSSDNPSAHLDILRLGNETGSEWNFRSDLVYQALDYHISSDNGRYDKIGVAFDPGVRNPTAYLILAFQNETWTVIGEGKITQSTVGHIWARVVSDINSAGYSLDDLSLVVCDPAARYFWLEITNIYGALKTWICPAKSMSVLDGIGLLCNYFRMNKIVINSNCKLLLYDLANYRWNKVGDAPDKARYDAHLLDALRYFATRIE